MVKSKMLLTQRNAWKQLETYATKIQFNTEALDALGAKLTTHFLSYDFSNQCIDSEVLGLLFELAESCEVPSAITALMSGYPINNHQPALHTALRADFLHTPMQPWVNHAVLASRDQMRLISEQIRQGEWLGYSGKPIRDVVNIGIGGSQLGPQFCIDAFKQQQLPILGFHFISDFDANECRYVLSKLNPETTLFIVSSKSFTTPETLINYKRALSWLGQHRFISQHFIAVTAHPDKAKQLGINHVIPIWDWVGGRYSLCSAINLITCIAIGYSRFEALLEGARSMDEHCRNTSMKENIPILLALLGIWNNNFLKIHNLVMLTYAQVLQWFVPYIQQLDMESNGKSIDKQGRAVNYATGPIVWGGLGNQGQHSYFQLLCQGTHRVAVDMVSIDPLDDVDTNQMCSAHKHVLRYGVKGQSNPNGYIPGNVPVNHLRLHDHSPQSLGALIALYEHKIFIQSVVWNINAFDQPGVESFKQGMRQLKLSALPVT